MIYSKALVLLGAAVMTATSSPLPQNERHCGDLFLPNLQISLSKDNPDTSYPNTWDTDQSVTISQNAGPTGKPLSYCLAALAENREKEGNSHDYETNRITRSNFSPNLLPLYRSGLLWLHP